jgi:ATP-dependent DNA ligase
MLASGFEQKLIDKIGFPAFVQLKLDGMRFNAIVRGDKIEFRSRNGRQLDIASDLFAKAFIGLANIYGTDIVFDGELLVVDSSGKPLDRKTGNGILTKAIKGTQSAKEGGMIRAILWDAIPFEYFVRREYKLSYKERFKSLVSKIEKFKSKSQISYLIDIVTTEVVNNQSTVNLLFSKYLDEGQEGIIFKSFNGIWEDKRSKDQVKFKAELECDLIVVGWEKGTGKNKDRLGALICESSDGLIRVNVGSGYTDAQREEFVVDYVKGKVVTIKYNARIKDKGGNVESLFLPTFIELREDKNSADNIKDIK